MKTLVICLVVMAAGAAGCAAHKTQRVPTLSGPVVPAAVEPARPNVLQQVGDTTWNVVSAPARLVAPKKEPSKQPEMYDAPTLIFERRDYGEEPAVPATVPGSAPATRP